MVEQPLAPDVEQRLHQDEDFIVSRRFEFSVAKLLERYPDGAPPRVIADAMGMTVEDLERHEAVALARLRREMGVEHRE